MSSIARAFAVVDADAAAEMHAVYIGKVIMHARSNVMCMLQLLDDHKNVVPLPPLAKGTLRLTPEALLPTWKLSTDRKRFLIKLRGQAGRVKIGLADNERTPLLHAPPGAAHDDAMGTSQSHHLTEVPRPLLSPLNYPLASSLTPGRFLPLPPSPADFALGMTAALAALAPS